MAAVLVCHKASQSLGQEDLPQKAMIVRAHRVLVVQAGEVYHLVMDLWV